MTTRFMALAALALACAGCAQFEPRPLDPAVEYEIIAARGRSPDELVSSSDLPRDLFPLSSKVSLDDGLSLAEANALALFHAPALVEARSRLRIRGAELLRAGLLSNPELFLGPRLDTDGGGLIFPASLSLEIPLGGRLGAEEDRASAELEAARRQLLATEARTLVDLRRRYIEFAALERQRALLEALVSASETALQQTRRRVQGGEDDGIVLALSTLDRDDLARELRKTSARIAQARLELAAALGLLPSPTLEVHVDPSLLAVVALPPHDRDALLRHPLLAALEARHRAAEHGLEAEIARQYPSIRIGPEFESDDGATSLGVGLSLSLPIFDSNSGGIALAEEQRVAGREAWRAALVELAGRAGLARARSLEAAAALQDLRSSTIPAADSAERFIAARLRGGQASLFEILAARSSIARARLAEIELMSEAAGQGLEALWYSGRLFPVGDGEGEER